MKAMIVTMAAGSRSRRSPVITSGTAVVDATRIVALAPIVALATIPNAFHRPVSDTRSGPTSTRGPPAINGRVMANTTNGAITSKRTATVRNGNFATTTAVTTINP